MKLDFAAFTLGNRAFLQGTQGIQSLQAFKVYRHLPLALLRPNGTVPSVGCLAYPRLHSSRPNCLRPAPLPRCPAPSAAVQPGTPPRRPDCQDKMAPRRQERPPSTEARSCLPYTPVQSQPNAIHVVPAEMTFRDDTNPMRCLAASQHTSGNRHHYISVFAPFRIARNQHLTISTNRAIQRIAFPQNCISSEAP
jgi:hypothetical protein